ncbi:MAG: hypothetical protein Q7J85_14175 [Bacillota bacterium]|nr:hypothetical protein [Bacillota bacterium]
MVWIIFAAIIWLFIIVFLRSLLGRFWSAGFWAILVGYFLNDIFIKNQFYLFEDLYYPFEGMPIGYLVALAGVGIIVVRFLPEEKVWQLPYLLLFSALFTVLEYFAVEQGFLLYLNWSLYYSFFYKLIAFITITWLSSLTVKRRKGYFYR